MSKELSPLPAILGYDKKITKPEEYFKLPARYAFNRLLGHGAYGLVCSATDYKLGSQVAIKRINQINSLLVAKRTLRELKLLRHFQGHPNIISILDLFKMADGSSFDELYITQELMDADLCHIIQSKYPISEEHVKRFLYQLLRGLKAMHSANVLHRDLKPGNILWKHNGELKICDFGLARGLAEPMDGCDISMTNYVATRWYRPPEILLYKAAYGKSLDIWSVGCILAELYGRKVFLPGASAMEQFHMIIQKMGTPSPQAIANIPSQKSRQYVERMVRYPAINYAEKFPNISPLGLDLLARMLEFDPTTRISAEEALRHPYLAAYHDPATEPNLPIFDFTFDSRCVTLVDIKNEILSELSLYRMVMPTPNVFKPDVSIWEQQSRDPVRLPRNYSIPNINANGGSIGADPIMEQGGQAESLEGQGPSRVSSFLQALPPIIKRRFSMPMRNNRSGPNSSA